MSDECLMKQETAFPFYTQYQAVMWKFTLADIAFRLLDIVVRLLCGMAMLEQKILKNDAIFISVFNSITHPNPFSMQGMAGSSEALCTFSDSC